MSEDTQNLPSLRDELSKKFLKEEQKQRRQELENLIARIESDQRNGLLFTGAIWGWLATHVHELHCFLDGTPTIEEEHHDKRWQNENCYS